MSSDCIIVPTRPSQPDAQGLFKTLEHIRAAQTDKTRIFAVLNNATDTKINSAIIKALKDNNAPLLSSKIGAYTGFSELHSTGELKGKARTSINSLIASLEIEKIL